MKILITGSTGLLGQALSRHLAPLGDVTGLSRHAPVSQAPGRHVVCDLLDGARIHEIIQQAAPAVVIHTQALSDVDRCEQEPVQARAMNVTATGHLVSAVSRVNAWLFSVSTDYVFDGASRRPYDEEDAPRPLSVYGRSKLDGERLALAYARSVVIRPSTLFGPGRMNFCDQVVTRLNAGEPVEAFVDQWTSPSYTEDVAEAMAQLVPVVMRSSAPSRVLHLSNAGGCSRWEFARRIAERLGVPADGLRGIRMEEQRRPAPRPAYSVLTSRYLVSWIGRFLPPWEHALERYLRQRHWIS